MGRLFLYPDPSEGRGEAQGEKEKVRINAAVNNRPQKMNGTRIVSKDKPGIQVYAFGF